MPRFDLSGPKFDAVIAGLRLLQSNLDNGDVDPSDGDVGAILTCDGTHPGLDAGQIDELCNELLGQ